MNALFRWLDVDRIQWRALLVASLKSDFASVRMKRATRRGSELSNSIGFALLIYGVAGISPAIAAYRASDVHFAGTLLATLVGFMVLSSLLIGEGATIIAPSDHHVLGFRPVTSRTYLAVRISALFVRTVVIASCIALASVVAFVVKDDMRPWRAMASLLLAWMTGLAVTLALVALYGWMLRLAGSTRMKRWASYTQFAAQSIAWGGFFVATQGIGSNVLAGYSMADHPVWYAFPGAWFGSYVALASGQVSMWTIVSALMSLALIAVLGKSIGGRLSLGYAESLAQVATSNAPRAAPAETRWLGVLSSETRAVALLLRSHLRHDMRFRLGLISLIPIMIMYTYLGGLPRDPFIDRATATLPSRGGNDSMIIMVMLLFLPPTLRRVLVTSSTYRASWIYHVTPSDHARLVLSSRNLITGFFLVPFLVLLTGILVYSFGNVQHAVVHATYLGMLSFLLLQAIIMFSPELPFSLPVQKEAEGGRMFAVMMGSVVAGMAMYILLVRVIYKSTVAMLGFAAAVGLLSWAMSAATKRRARRGTMTYAE